MKKFLKALAVVLAMTLVIGVIPVSAASTELSLKKTSKTLFIGGCTGAKASTGKKAPYYSYTTLKKLVNNYDADTMIVRATSSDASIVKTSKTRMTAVSLGTATITIKVYKGSVKTKNLLFTGDIKVTVKKNASKEELTYSGIKNNGTYTVGDKIKVAVPRSKTDTDGRRLIAKSSNVTLSSAGTRKWYVTFTKAGAFELLAESYQSSTYNKATQSLTIKGTVVEPEPEVVEPTGSVKQLSANSFEIQGNIITSDLEAADITLEYVAGSYTLPYLKSFNLDIKKDVATVTMFSSFEAGTTYYVTVDGLKMSFVAAGGSVKDVTSMEIVTEKVLANLDQNIEFKFFAGSVDITDYVGTELKATTSLELLSGDSYAVLNSGAKSILFFDKNQVATIKATCIIGYKEDYTPITIVCTGSIQSYEEPAPTLTGLIYTVAPNDFTYMTKTDKQSHEFAIGDDISFEVLFAYSNGTYKTLAEEGITKVASSDETVVMMDISSLSGGYKLKGNHTGTVKLIMYKGEIPFRTAEISVLEARTATSISAEVSKPLLNVNSMVGDQLKITATVKDQYGEAMTGLPITITQEENTKAHTGSVMFGGFYGGVLYVNSTDVALLPGHTTNLIIGNIKCGTLSTIIKFTVDDIAYDPAKLNEYTLSLDSEGPTLLDATLDIGMQTFDSVYFAPTVSKNGYFLAEPPVKFCSVRPTASMKASDFGVPDGDTSFYMTVTYNGECLSAGNCIQWVYSGIDITPVAYGEKLKPGNYVVSLYKITAGTAGSMVGSPIAVKTFTVVDNASDVTYSNITDTASCSTTEPWASKLSKFMTFYYDGVKIDNSSIMDAIVDANYSEQSHDTFIKSIKLVLYNSAYGNFEVNVPIVDGRNGQKILHIVY